MKPQIPFLILKVFYIIHSKKYVQMQKTKIANTRIPSSFKETNNSATALQMFPKYTCNLPFLPSSTLGGIRPIPDWIVRLGLVVPTAWYHYLVKPALLPHT